MYFLMERLKSKGRMREFLAVIVLLQIFPVSLAVQEQECNLDTHFKCAKNHVCIPKSFHCDHDFDCGVGDNSDEESCDHLFDHEDCHGMHMCNISKNCISLASLCNGEFDCGDHDHSDEENCHHNLSHPVTCKPDELPCADKVNCIPAKHFCDEVMDCLDFSDENNCSGKCSEFQCKSGECIEFDLKCDGTVDCMDESDEDYCPPWSRHVSNCLLEHHLFLCKDKSRCLPQSKVCDSKFDCLDGSDEKQLCSNDSCHNYNCSHDVFNTPLGCKCVCPIGMKYSGDKCIDIDECENYAQCDQICHNTEGSFQCLCHEGYSNKHGDICIAEDDTHPLMVYSNENSIQAYYLRNEHFSEMVEFDGKSAAVAYDGHSLYWSSMKSNGHSSIIRSNEFGLEKEVVVTSGLLMIEDLSVDWITRNIYFSDSGKKHIGVCSNDGINCLPIISNVTNVFSLVLHSNKGMLFFSSLDVHLPCIVKAGMDGNNKENIVAKDIWPNALALDIPNNRLYWSDAKLTAIESINLDGSNRIRLSLSKTIGSIFSLDVFENRLYWTDVKTNELISCNKFNGRGYRIIKRTHEKMFGIHIYHPVLFKQIKNPCKYASCSHLCLLSLHNSSDITYTCACPTDMFLTENKHTCKSFNKKEQLIVASNAAINIINYHSFGRIEFDHITHTVVTSLGAVSYDSHSGDIILSDLNEGSIIAFNPITMQVKQLHHSKNAKIVSIDYDPLGNNLYWVDAFTKSIQLLNMQTLLNVKLIQDLGNDVLLDLVLDLNDRYLFVALMYGNHIHIDRFSMDGDKKTRIHLAEKNFVGPRIALAFDHQLDKLLWSDYGNGAIYSIDKTGSNREKLIAPETALSDIAVMEDTLFWVNVKSNKLHWANHHDDLLGSDISLRSMNNNTELKIAKISMPHTSLNNECHSVDAQCSHICIPLINRKQCVCPDELDLDENGLHCIKPKLCGDNEFKCSNGKCLPMEVKCNRKNDCPEGEDEQHCENHTVTCLMNTFHCLNGKQCIDIHKHCDDTPDCSDGSDEFDCRPTGCQQGEFQCSSGGCIHAALQCDGVIDCSDESDESNCRDFSCTNANEFKCGNGACIPKSWECDGEVNCVDHSDEHQNCAKHLECSHDHFKCDNGHCVHNDLKCNGEDDCDDMSDERTCSTHVINVKHEKKCTDAEFACESDLSVCLPQTAKCNGTAECPRGEDENSCGDCIDKFKCQRSNNCIPKDWVCDGVNDCADYSDEMNCQETHVKITSKKCDHFQCSTTSECLAWDQVCDNVTDCADKSDEGPSCDTSCINSRCSHKCQKMPNGHKCFCPSGFRLDGNGINCVDINECVSLNACSQYCNNTVGSFKCYCESSQYKLRSDKISCKALGPEMAFAFTSNKEIRCRTSNNIDLVKLDFEIKDITGFDLDMRSRVAYLSSEYSNTLIKVNLENRKMYQVKNVLKPTKVSYDWSTGNVYFVNNKNSIHACNFAKETCAKIYSAKSDVTIDALRIDSKDRSIFWSESHSLMVLDAKSALKKSDLAGKDVKVLTDQGIKKVGDIVLDSINHVMYWTDSIGKKVEKMSFEGKNRRIIFDNIEAEPLHLNVFEDHIFWLNGKCSEMHKRMPSPIHQEYTYITKCGLFGRVYRECETIKLLPSNNKIQHFRILHSALQMLTDKDCEHLSCSYMCVQRKKIPSCICSDGSLVKPGQNCSASHTDTIFEELLSDNHKNNYNLLKNPSTSYKWLWWMLFMVPLWGLISWLIYFYIVTFVKSYSSGNKTIPGVVHFHNPSFGLNEESEEARSTNPLIPGNHCYENPINKENSWNIKLICNNEMKNLQGKIAWPSLNKEAKKNETGKMADDSLINMNV
ncbi:vitellogenin receptor [Cimex lectularius]|uniref:EGF-like domain-containing protein n=1 Tax=Cimex lectularius TaxID=79782 RepID=A0A8I6RSZ7_CIMLE|nr:vitellogenin receptor [Cimex lectularius]